MDAEQRETRLPVPESAETFIELCGEPVENATELLARALQHHPDYLHATRREGLTPLDYCLSQ